MAAHTMPKESKQTITVKDIELTVESDLFDDLEVLELLGKMNPSDDTKPDAGALPAFLKRVLGESQYKKVKNALRDTYDGRVHMDSVSDFIQEFISKVAPNT